MDYCDVCGAEIHPRRVIVVPSFRLMSDFIVCSPRCEDKAETADATDL